MQIPDYVRSYKELLAQLVAVHGRDRAMELIVGGEYEQIGILECSALLTLGLEPTHCLVDVGCGSGRLAVALKHVLTGQYIGTDVLPEALAYARERAERSDWAFIQTADITIPVADHTADAVSFFSLFTHLLDEDIYLFLQEARRVVKPGGRIVFSYLDFEEEMHWPVWEATVANRDPHRVINRFISKGTLRCWAKKLGLEVDELYDGSRRWVTLTQDFTYADGRLATGVVAFGQSIGVLRAPG